MTFDLSVAGGAGLAAAGVAAGFINTLAGGGSLLTLPALMLAGLDAGVANGTNRVAVLLQSLIAARTFDGGGRLDRRATAWIVAPTLAGAAAGAWLAAALPPEVLEPALLVTMVVMALLFATRPRLLTPAPGEGPGAVRGNPRAMAALLATGLYGGFIQAGIGFLLLATLVGALRYDLVAANAIKMVVVAALTVVALAIFIADDLVAWGPGLVLASGSVLGGYLGARFAMRTDQRVLRWIIVVTVIVATVALLLR